MAFLSPSMPVEEYAGDLLVINENLPGNASSIGDFPAAYGTCISCALFLYHTGTAPEKQAVKSSHCSARQGD